MTLHPMLACLVLMDVVGGTATLASYVLWLGHPSNDPGQLWGSISGSARTLYTVSMFTAAAGFFAFTAYFLRLDPERVRFGRGHGFGWILTLHALFLFPSAFWMPLTYEYLDGPTSALWWAMRIDLFVVGLASLGLIHALAVVTPRDHPTARAVALAGSIAFAFQTAVLDALVWPLYFPAA